MSAEIFSFPEREFKPEAEACTDIIDDCQCDFGKLFDTAKMAMAVIQAHKDAKSSGPEAYQGIANMLFVAFLATGTMLGILPTGAKPSADSAA